MTSSADDEGLENAAILLMSLGEEEAAEVLKHLAPKEVQRLGETIARLQIVPRERLGGVLRKFSELAGEQHALVRDPGEYVRAVLRRALGDDKAKLLLDRIQQGGDIGGIDTLKWMDPAAVAELLRQEHPQIVAAILVHLDRDHAGAVLRAFGERTRNDVLARIATLDGIQPTALADLNEVIGRIVAGGERARKTALGGVKAAAEIIGQLGSAIEASVLDYIREADASLAEQIADNLLTFDDLEKLDDKAIQLLLREIQTESLVIALKGATPGMRDKVLRNMSARAADALREDLEARGPVRVSEVEAEQKELIKTVRRLADEGQIALASGSGDDFV